jgi:Polysaccharide deacetylase
MRPPLPLAALALAALLSLTACVSTSSPGAGSPTSGSSASGAQGGSVVDQAKLKASQYDYDGALALLASDSGADAAAKADITKAKAAAQPWTEPNKVPHLFWHPLVVDPARAFSTKLAAADRAGNAQYMVTQSEFAAQLQSIYDKGYVLIHPERLYQLKDGVMTSVADQIKLPPGKKPLVISQDDVNYYKRWADEGGFPAELKVAADGTIVNRYTDAAGATTEGAFDVVPMVDAFVRQHPDFSYQGDKGSIALTGYEGALGYRSSVKADGDTAATKQAAADAKKVADAMKAEGWNFASHTWNHISYSASSAAQIKADMDLWKAEVEPITGPTPELIYAFGSDLANSIGKSYAASDPKYQVVKDAGFSYFFPIDNSSPYFAQVKDGYYRQWRVDIDGITMQKVLDGKPTALPLFFDTKALWDPLRPNPTPTLATGVK